jgi:hydroxylamine reductase
MSQNQMFCYQCEQTAKGQGCTIMGVCGKNPEVAALQDLLIYKLRGLSQLTVQAAQKSIKVNEIDIFTCEALFSTLTNVNFNPQRIVDYLQKTVQLEDQLKNQLKIETINSEAVNLKLEKTTQGLVSQGKTVGIHSNTTIDPDLHSLQWLLTYGLKGIAAYTYHAFLLGKKDQKVFDFIHKGLAAPLDASLGVNDFVSLVLKCGEINIRAMEILDAGNTERYGHPTPTKVPLGHKKGKAILVSGTRSHRFGRDPKAKRGQKHNNLYSWRNASNAWLSRIKEVSALLWALWNSMAKSAKRICRIPRSNPNDYKLHSKTRRKLQGKHIHHRTSRIYWCPTYRRQRLLSSN